MNLFIVLLLGVGMIDGCDDGLAKVLERQLRAGAITPEQAVSQYCDRKPSTMQIDAFCSSPKDAAELVRKRLSQSPTD